MCPEPGDAGQEQTPGCRVRVPPGVCRPPEKALQRHQSSGAPERTARTPGGDVHTPPGHAGRFAATHR